MQGNLYREVDIYDGSKTRLFSVFDVTGIGLEIGPSFNPQLPKGDGYRVEMVDSLSAADLRKKYKMSQTLICQNRRG